MEDILKAAKAVGISDEDSEKLKEELERDLKDRIEALTKEI